MTKPRDLSQDGSNAILSLLRSIAPDVVPDDGKKLSGDDVRKINEKLTELLGPDTENLDSHERGELVNEEGLPIVDIAEPTETADSQATGTFAAADSTLISLASLSEAERERLRQERDRILDLLEEEEKYEEQRERDLFMEERKEIIRKKLEETAKEKERTSAAKELQKKMAKGLIAGICADPKENSNLTQSGSPEAKKTVTFASEPATSDDVVPATLRKSNRPTLLGAVDGAHLPMKMNVVERKPVCHSTKQMMQPIGIDSDDDSNPDEEDDRYDKDPFAEEASDELISEIDATDQSQEDLDYAGHQREIAIEYYAKRGIIGQDAAQAMMSHPRAEDEERGFLTDIGVTELRSKPSISHFKASKLASSYNASLPSETKSLDGSILSASSAKSLQHSIRLGKLDSQDRLMGYDEDSGSEPENEAAQEILDLLKKGQVYNIGPNDDQVLKTVPPPPPKREEQRTSAVVSPLDKLKISKFKVDRSQAGPSKAGQNQAKTISTGPKFSANVVVGMERPPGKSSLASSSHIPPITSAIVDSPNFPRASEQKLSVGVSQQPMVIDSPSFSMLIASPSFPPPKRVPHTMQPSWHSSSSHPDDVVSFTQAEASRRPTRPPTVMSSVVREKASQPIVEKDVRTPTTYPSQKDLTSLSRTNVVT